VQSQNSGEPVWSDPHGHWTQCKVAKCLVISTSDSDCVSSASGGGARASGPSWRSASPRAPLGRKPGTSGCGGGSGNSQQSPYAYLVLAWVSSPSPATPSNCGKALKTVSTKGAPKGGQIRSVDPLTGRAACAWPGITTRGTVTTTGMCQWVIRSQALPLGKGSLGDGRVSALPPPSRTPRPGHGCSSETRRWWAAPPVTEAYAYPRVACVLGHRDRLR